LGYLRTYVWNVRKVISRKFRRWWDGITGKGAEVSGACGAGNARNPEAKHAAS